ERSSGVSSAGAFLVFSPRLPAASGLPVGRVAMDSGESSGAEIISFARALASSLRPPKVDLPLKAPAFTDDGFPTVYFTKEEARRSELPLRFAIVAKCSYGRPSIPDIKSCLLQRLALKGDCILSFLNPRHLLLWFLDEEDFLKVLVRKNLYLKGYLFRFFRWSSDFNFSADPTLIPIWLTTPIPVSNVFERLADDMCLNGVPGGSLNIFVHEATHARPVVQPSKGPNPVDTAIHFPGPSSLGPALEPGTHDILLLKTVVDVHGSGLVHASPAHGIPSLLLEGSVLLEVADTITHLPGSTSPPPVMEPRIQDILLQKTVDDIHGIGHDDNPSVILEGPILPEAVPAATLPAVPTMSYPSFGRESLSLNENLLQTVQGNQISSGFNQIKEISASDPGSNPSKIPAERSIQKKQQINDGYQPRLHAGLTHHGGCIGVAGVDLYVDLSSSPVNKVSLQESFLPPAMQDPNLDGNLEHALKADSSLRMHGDDSMVKNCCMPNGGFPTSPASSLQAVLPPKPQGRSSAGVLQDGPLQSVASISLHGNSPLRLDSPATNQSPLGISLVSSKATSENLLMPPVKNTRWVLGNGESIKFLDGVWFGEKSIRESVSYGLQESSPTVKEVFTDLYHPLRYLIPMGLDNVACSVSVIRYHIHYMVNVALDNLVFKQSATPQQMAQIKEFGFSYIPPVKTVRMVRWIPPLHGPLLNPFGGGGIVRTSDGTVLFAFAHFYGSGTSLLSECRDGVQMALEKGVPLTLISSDSLVMVNFLHLASVSGGGGWSMSLCSSIRLKLSMCIGKPTRPLMPWPTLLVMSAVMDRLAPLLISPSLVF
ncbi:hypothetical protein Taro_021293, partial [Colocasia esculenta]|nr:hypothetical protein [Colocasia esculenta]